MRICIDARKINDFGIGTHVRNLLRHLAALDTGHELIALGPDPENEAVRDLGDRVTAVPDSSKNYSLREQVSVSRHLLRLRPDLFHATHYVLPAVVPCPAVVTIHDAIHLLFPELLRSRLAHPYAKWMMGRSIARARRVLTVSESTRRDLARLFGRHRDKIEVVHNGVEGHYFERLGSEEKSRLLSALGLIRPYFLFVGNPKPHKNLERLVEGYAKANRRSELDQTLVCIGGERADWHDLTRRAEVLGVGNRLILGGHVDSLSLRAIYQEATALLYPSLYEGFGLPVVEAMASGTPVLTSQGSALAEVAAEAALLVDPWIVEEITEGILRLANEPTLRETLRQRGLDRAHSFRWAENAQKTMAIYETVV